MFDFLEEQDERFLQDNNRRVVGRLHSGISSRKSIGMQPKAEATAFAMKTHFHIPGVQKIPGRQNNWKDSSCTREVKCYSFGIFYWLSSGNPEIRKS